ncbi:hypothetical protein KP509_32G010600 [Ceratopteris richardii]|nr:hypothetical protein KP509_32G010600 [Ceratopteris richardii]
MTSNYLDQYFKNRAFYQIQSQSIIDNPDQRIVDDLNSFTGTALSFALAIFNAAIDLISFSGILYGIYPPLFFILIAYSIGGTAVSVALGKGLVNLNFQQEKKEADFRFGLVRIRENSESIAFYQGERNEIQLLLDRFKRLFENYSDLLVASRNLEFFQSGYRYIIQVLPAAVVAPMYFSGKIEFGVINQSYSAFNHILSDFSIVIYQFQALSAFSAVIDRLGEFTDVLEKQSAEIEEVSTDLYPLIDLVDRVAPASSPVLLQIENLSLQTPQYTMTLIKDLTLTVCEGQSLLVMGASGSGKTSLLRAIAGLWRSGRGIISRFILPLDDNSDGAPLQTLDVDCENIASMTEEETTRGGVSDGRGSILFLPQRPYMVLGTLRQQLLYPTWSGTIKEEATSNGKGVWDLPVQSGRSNFVAENTPSDDRLEQVLLEVNLGNLLERCEGLDSQVEWSSILSLGEQQRLAFARLLLARPRLALLDESTSALDEDNEAALYNLLQTAGITYISVGHRSSLCKFHSIRLTVEEPRQAGLDRNWNVDYLTA